MTQSASSAGDLAAKVKTFLEKEYGSDVEWDDNESDTIRVMDEMDVPLVVKVDLA